MSPPMIQVDDLCYRREGRTILDGVSFSVTRGETCCLLGRSGVGKSTLFQLMLGLLEPDHGTVTIDGRELHRVSPSERVAVRRKLGALFQGGALIHSLTLAQNVALPLEVHTRQPAEIIETVVKLKLQQVDLLDAADRTPSEVSGGMVTRAALARAMALDPRVLLYDEPHSGLDPATAARIDKLIGQLQAAFGMTSLVITQLFDSVRRLADHVLVLDRGQIVLDGTIDDLLASGLPAAQRFVGGDARDLEERAQQEEQFYRDLLE